MFKLIVYIFVVIFLLVIRIFGGNFNEFELFIMEEELKIMVGVSEEEGVLENVEKEMIFNVFEFVD